MQYRISVNGDILKNTGLKLRTKVGKEREPKKIFCEDCKFFSVYVNPRLQGPVFHDCNNERNLRYKDHYNYKETIYLKLPKKLNQRNDCKWFKPEPKTTVPKPPRSE